MGLFSFIKDAGAKLFGKKDKTPEVKAVVKTVEEQKREDLRAEVARLNLPIQGLAVTTGTSVIVHGSTETNADREKVILALGNIAGVTAVQDNIAVMNAEPESVFHEVKSGDTLSKISKAVYGDPMRYNEIFEANKPMLSHPDKIYPGQMLRIPQ